MIRLVTRADDIGCAISANKAAYDATTQGILRNYSLLACAHELEDAAQRLLGLEGVNFGLHASVTSEWDQPRWQPVAPADQVPGLCSPDGAMYQNVQDVHAANVPAEQVLVEIKAQLARLREVGFNVSYIDTHMGFAWLEGVDDGVRELAHKEGLIYRPKVDRAPKTDWDEMDCAGSMVKVLNALPDGTFLIVGHPMYDDAETRSFGRADESGEHIALTRNGQREMFMRPDVVAVAQARGIEPIRYDEI
jgi:predicted glycoside hydrolase/deacetylase ChbG (UPF0249 family)